MCKNMFQRDVVSLFFVINAIGNIPLFLAILARFDPPKQRSIIVREFSFALGILLLFNFFGIHVLNIIGISPPVIGIAGGAVLFLIAISMVFPREKQRSTKVEPMIVPLAMPVIAGPGTITAVMIFTNQAPNPFIVTAAIIVALGISLAIILASSYIRKWLGEKGMVAIERLGGMIIALIGMQMIVGGIVKLVQHDFFGIPYGG